MTESMEEKVERLSKDHNGLVRECDRLLGKRNDLKAALELLLPGETDPIRRAHIEAALKKDAAYVDSGG
jgi:hypothetical protein